MVYTTRLETRINVSDMCANLQVTKTLPNLQIYLGSNAIEKGPS